MPTLPSLETLRRTLSDPDALRSELWRRRVPLGTDAELLAWVEYAFGLRIPAVACCPAHQTPAQAFCDAYFGRVPVAIWKASRGFGGKSTLLALLAMTEAITLGVDVVVLGGSGQQSERVLDAMGRMWPTTSWGRALLASAPGVRKTTLAQGNTIIALPASQTAVRGPHPPRLRIDEMDEIPLNIVDAAMGQPMDRGVVRSQTVLSSTHQYPDGTMTAMLTRAAQSEWRVYAWCWRESMEPHGWLTQAQIERTRSAVTAQMWNIEYDLQEPSAVGRAIDPDAVEWTFDSSLGTATATDLDHGWVNEAPVHADGVYYAHGADWAQAVDFTVIASLRCDSRPLRLVAAYRSHRRPWPVMIGKLDEAMANYPGAAAHDHTGSGGVVGEWVRGAVIDVDMVGQRRRDLFNDYIAALERHEITMPRIEPFYSEHRYCRAEDLFGSGHPPDTVVACALAFHAFRNRRAPGDYGITI